MATTQLTLYNDALLLLGTRRLETLTDATESRRLLDAVWASSAHDAWLEESDWGFASRSVKLGFDTSYTASFGHQYRFAKPSDLVRVSGVYVDEHMQVPHRDYLDEGEYWYADSEELYVHYVSNDNSYGGNLGIWSASFAKYVAAFLAMEIAPALKNSKDIARMQLKFEERQKEAMSVNSSARPSKRMPQGSWANARLGGGTRYRPY
jgi:hypothetical protein